MTEPGSSAAASRWGSPLGRWLRGVVSDSSSSLPSLDRVIEAVRQELIGAPTLGVLFVRPEQWGRASDLFSWRETEETYRSLTQAALDLVGQGVRRLDLPSDLGLYGEGLAYILCAPRQRQRLTADDVAMVADRVAEAFRARLESALPPRLFERMSLEVGSGLVHRPVGDETLEDALVTGLVAAEGDARGKQRARLTELGRHLEGALDQGRVEVLFQPLVDVRSGGVAGFDTTVRGPSFFNLSLGDVFFDVAHRIGSTFRAYDLYHENALQLAEGHVTGHEFVILRVSASDILESAVRVMSHLYRRGATLAPSNVVFLVEAGAALEHAPSSVVALRSVDDMGFRIALDLSADCPLPLDHLRELPADLLRVGGRTVRQLDHHQDEYELVLMLSRFATRHGMRVLGADCTERGEVLALRRAAVDLLQGDYFAPFASAVWRPAFDLP